MATDTSGRCSNPPMFRRLTAYSFGDLEGESHEGVRLHVAECALCSRELARLESCILALRRDPHLQPLEATPEVLSVFGLSSRLDQPFGGHARHAFVSALLFSLLFAVPFLVEVAFEFDRFGRLGIALGIIGFFWMLPWALVGLRAVAESARQGRPHVSRPLVSWLAGTSLLVIAAWVWLPSRPTVEASFGTWPAHLGYLKSVAYAWPVGLVFLLWPFHFVLAMQRELLLGRYQSVFRVLAREPLGVPPRGVVMPPVWALTLSLAALGVFNYVGVNHLFGALKPDTDGNLFRVLVLVRVSAWLGLSAWCLWWYVASLNELKREAVAGLRLTQKETSTSSR